MSFGFLLGPALGGFLIGVLGMRLVAGASRKAADVRSDDVNHRIRALEADLRVAQRTAEHLKAERDAQAVEFRKVADELATLRGQTETVEERARKLKSDLQHECGKTAKLRQELADRAEEMVRTSVQLRDVQNELGVNQVGSDVILEQIARLEQEREDLNSLVATLRRELATRAAENTVERSVRRGPDALLDC